MLVIKLKGIKRNFSESPVDFEKMRKDDVHQPKGNFFKKYILRTFNVLNSTVTEIGKSDYSDKLLLFIHGGAYISGPAQHHWDSIKSIASRTDVKIWLCDYPKAPETKILEISNNIDAVYEMALKEYDSSKIYLIGDSVGGALSISLVQRLIEQKRNTPQKLILISPVMDASMTNPEIEGIENNDPMLSIKGVLSAKKMCAGDKDLKNKMISPLYGSFEEFPETFFFLAQNDIMYPDQKLAIQKLQKTNANITIFEGIGMPHIWPILPVMKEAKVSLDEIIKVLDRD